MKWLLILHFSTGAQMEWRVPYRTLAECENTRQIAIARYAICEMKYHETERKLVGAECVRRHSKG